MLVEPLEVTVGDRLVTGLVDELRFDDVDPGGHGAGELRLSGDIDPGEFDYLAIYDRRSGELIQDGYVDEPAPARDPRGNAQQISFLGAQAQATDCTRPLCYDDRNLSRWVPADDSAPTGQISTVDFGGTGQYAIKMHVPRGTVCATGYRIGIVYRGLESSLQTLGLIDYIPSDLKVDTNWAIRCYVDPGAELVRSDTLGVGVASSPRVTTTHFTAGLTTVRIYLERTGSTVTVADDITLTHIFNPIVRSRRFDRNVNVLEGSGNYGFFTYADEIVEDLLGRFFTLVDPDRAYVHPSEVIAFLEQAAYPDGAHGRKVLEDVGRREYDPSGLPVSEPRTWWIRGRYTDSGLHSFYYGPPDDEVRYVATEPDSLVLAGSGEGRFNAAWGRWTDIAGQLHSERRSITLPEFAAAGRLREKLIDLGDEAASTPGQAQNALDLFLASQVFPVNSGTYRLTQRVLDLRTGLRVDPWEIQAGYVIEAPGELASPDALNLDSTDGVSRFRVRRKSHTCGQPTTLELENSPPTVEHLVAAGARAFAGRRRR